MDEFEWRERNLASDAICDGLRVSTGIVATYPMGEKWLYIETFIFSDVPWQRTTQISHGRNPEKAMRAYTAIVANMKKLAAQHGTELKEALDG